MIRRDKVSRTPVVGGRLTRKLTDLVSTVSDIDDDDVDAALELNEQAPHREEVWGDSHEAMLDASVCYYAEQRLRGPLEAPYHGKFLIEPFHLEWDEHINKYDRIVELAARDHGKCAVAGSLVRSPSGRLVPIEHWIGGPIIAYDRGSHRLRIAEHSSPSKPQGWQRCLQIVTKTGRTERVTHNHHFYGADGLVRADALELGQRIVCAQRMGGPVEQWIESNPLFWDEVTRIQNIGFQQTYGIEVPGYHSYVGQDVINGNSHFFSLALPLWFAERRYPGKIGYLFSATQTLAEDLLKIIREEVQGNSNLAHLRLKEDGNARELKLRNGSVIRARGFGVKIRGGHPPWIICDDCLSDDDIYSETTRRKNIDFFLSAITNMVIDGGIIVTVGTPLHHADLYAHLRSTGIYKFFTYKAIDNGRILFARRYSEKRLEKRKNEIGAARFAREFLCVPLSDEASLFPSRLFEGIRMPYRLGLPADWWEAKGMFRYTAVDFAMSSSAQGDYTVILTIAVDDNGNRWLANMRRGKGWSFQHQLDLIEEENALMRPEVIFAEANQMQRIFADELVRTTALPIKKFYTAGKQPKQPWKKGMTAISMSKHHIERGIPRIQMSLENGKWRIPRGDAHSIEMTDVWIGELQAFSFQDGKVVSVGEHDDSSMATWMSECAADEYGNLQQFSFGEEETQQAQSVAMLPGALQHQTDEDRSNSLPEPRASRHQQDWQPDEGAPMPWDLPGF